MSNIIQDTEHYFNEGILEIVADYISERLSIDPRAKLRIVQIDAGTGRTGESILPMLSQYTEHIEEYSVTDINDIQGIDEGRYDIVIAANILHTDKNIKQVLRSVKVIMKKNGLILTNELSNNSKSSNEILANEGFKSVFVPVQEEHYKGYQIIIAESDGIIVQRTEDIVRDVAKEKKKQADLLHADNKRQLSMPIKGNSINREALKEKSEEYIKKLVGDALKIPSHRIDSSDPLEAYGVDSILAIQITNSLQEVFRNINNTLLFEHQTVSDLAEYFMNTQRDVVLKITGLEEDDESFREADRSFEEDTESFKRAEESFNGSEKEEIVAKTDNVNRDNIRIMGRFLKSYQDDKDKVLEDGLSQAQDIAIIGISGRYPEAEDIEKLWDNLISGKDCITEIPKERWDHSLYFDEDKETYGKCYSKWGGFIDGVQYFDPLFFNISPKEAEIMDPQERLFLECVWNLLESTGHTKESLEELYQKKVGVYAGSMYQHYHYYNQDIITASAVSLSSYSSIANRVSYFFDFKGPSIAVDTACSSSAVAIHMACESLLKGECQLAIAGGINLSIHPNKYIGLSLAKMLGSNPEIRSFGDGNGFFPSEAVGAVLLKPLKKAVLDGDSILAVIKSTAVNHDGHSNGYTVPNLNAQAELFEENFKKSSIEPRTISYVESAANGSAIGDPVEVMALTKAFQKITDDKQFCAIGTIKSNIGHAEAASGISQLTKVVLQLKNKMLVPSIKTEPLNPNINFKGTPFYLQTKAEEWKQPVLNVDGRRIEFPRRAAINSFGAGGTNAQIIVEEYITPNERDEIYVHFDPQIVVFSAKTESSLKIIVENMFQFLKQHDVDLESFAYTLQVGRNPMEYRWAAVVHTKEELLQLMSEYLNEDENKSNNDFPVFLGNSQDDALGVRSFFSGTLGETLIKFIIEEKNLEKLAIYWSQGGKVQWELLHLGRKMRMIPLPTYPFEKRRCWVEYKPVPMNMKDDFYKIKTATYLKSKDIVLEIILELLGMSKDEIDITRAINNYGFDSIMLMQLVRKLQVEFDLDISLEKLKDCKTIKDIIDIADTKSIYRPKVMQSSFLMKGDKAKFPELIHLNQSNEGVPVFWIHSALGGVEVYQNIASKSQRPFYGIQSRGWMTDRSPLHKIQAMAAYYVHIIQAVQPEGPYDLGGYSLGGSLAYEVARQLQELGEVVNTIVMLDSLYFTMQSKVSVHPKKVILQIINMALQLSNSENKPLDKILIHRNEVSSITSDETFLEQLIMIAKTRGLTKTEKQLNYLINQCTKALNMGKPDDYAGLPLPYRDAVTCYYFRNKSGLFYGDLEPYFTIENEEKFFKKKNYWAGWEQQLPNFVMMDVDSPNHMSLLSAPSACKPVEEFCEKLYSYSY